jgi:hypothetical protein
MREYMLNKTFDRNLGKIVWSTKFGKESEMDWNICNGCKPIPHPEQHWNTDSKDKEVRERI